MDTVGPPVARSIPAPFNGLAEAALALVNASYCLAGIIGDGAGTNQVFFNVSELFWRAGGGNFSTPGTQPFTADVLGLYGRPSLRVRTSTD